MQTIESPTETIERSLQEPTRVRPGTAFAGPYLDIALVVARESQWNLD
jgi:hypothetical protein